SRYRLRDRAVRPVGGHDAPRGQGRASDPGCRPSRLGRVLVHQEVSRQREGSAMIVCQCPACKRLLQVNDLFARKPVQCPLCRKSFVAAPLVSAAAPPTDDEVYTDLEPVEEEII